MRPELQPTEFVWTLSEQELWFCPRRRTIKVRFSYRKAPMSDRCVLQFCRRISFLTQNLSTAEPKYPEFQQQRLICSCCREQPSDEDKSLAFQKQMAAFSTFSCMQTEYTKALVRSYFCCSRKRECVLLFLRRQRFVFENQRRHRGFDNNTKRTHSFFSFWPETKSVVLKSNLLSLPETTFLGKILQVFLSLYFVCLVKKNAQVEKRYGTEGWLEDPCKISVSARDVFIAGGATYLPFQLNQHW